MSIHEYSGVLPKSTKRFITSFPHPESHTQRGTYVGDRKIHWHTHIYLLSPTSSIKRYFLYSLDIL